MTARVRLAALAALVAAAAGCGDVIRGDRSGAILNVSSMTGLAGNDAAPSSVLLSDVQVLLRAPAPCTPASPCPTIFNDVGEAVLTLSMKDITVTPSSNNQVTLSRYAVRFRRSDGRGIPGQDLPHDFEGSVTATIPPGGTATVSFELVRHVAKQEPPLAQLVTNANIIYAVADVTFYGQDLVGNNVSATGSISVNFGNFADEQ